MDWTYRGDAVGERPHSSFGGDHLDSSYTTCNYAPDAARHGYAVGQWTPSPGGDVSSPGFPYAFPPPFPPPPSSHAANQQPPPSGFFPNTYAAPTRPPFVPSFSWTPQNSVAVCPVDEATVQRKQDEEWLAHFLRNTSRVAKDAKTPLSGPDLKDVLREASHLVSRLSDACQSLTDNLDDNGVWAVAYGDALRLKADMQSKLSSLAERSEVHKRKMRDRRARRLRSRKLAAMERAARETRMAEKEGAIDKWRMRRVHQVEEKKKARELKMAADAVLSEVRKKQSDIKRMQDVLKSLEKLRRLRKDAAMRKGIATEPEAEAAFQSQLEALRRVTKTRTAIYTAEEKALMVMLDSRQEEQRKELRKKDREKRLYAQQQADAMLFGERVCADAALQAFTDYYTQSESSLHALLQVRRQWDVFLVGEGSHHEGNAIPQGWVLPEPPSHPAWASALV
nr:programmed cell death protein 7-like isoform X1 [Nerophis lumbriciformis]